MRSHLISRLILPLGLLLTAFPSSSHAAVQNRIAAVSGNSRLAVPGTVSGRVKLATDLGPAPADTKLESLSLRFSFTAAQQASLTQLMAAQLNPSSSSYHQWLTPEQFGAQFGLSSSDLAKVSSWLTSQGFAITGVARSSTFITFTGTVAQAQQAFGTSIHSLSYNGEPHYSNTTDTLLPSAIAGVVNAVTGLNDFRPKPHSRPRSASAAASPRYTLPIGGVTSHFISPADFYNIYDMNSLIGSSSLSTSTAGQGFTIAVVGQTDPILADVANFRTAAGLPPVTTTNFKTQLFGTDPGNSNSDIDESHIDMEWSGAAAPGATILYVYGADALLVSMTQAIDKDLAPIVSSSYGDCETGSGTATLNSLNQLLQQANAQGMTVISAAGDLGATDCESAALGGPAVEGLNVDFPGSSPFATSAGGTMFSGDISSPGTYWSSSNGSTGGSALSYIPEQPWNETTPTLALSAGGSGGGGASAFFAKPSWQLVNTTGAGNTPNDDSRDVPDFALNAAANHDGYLVCSSGVAESNGATELPCSSGFLDTTGEPNVFGGTSFVAPSFAGILAVIEQKLGGKPNVGIGNINPILYGLANGPTYSSIFHDITTGNNAIPCSQGTPNCSGADPAYNNGSVGYNAGTGYDQASGLGSLDVNNLATGWKTATPAGVGGSTSAGAVLSNTTVTTSSAVCGISGSTLALTVTVASGTSTAPTTFPSLPASSAVPTGMVQVLVDNAKVGSPQALVNGVATISLSTSTITSGGHTITAAYLGDGTFASSKGALLAPDPTGAFINGTLASVDFVSSSKPDFSFTATGSNPCTGAVSVAPGSVASGITFTVTPVNGFTGPVNLVATNTDLANATTSFTVTPITISSASGVTTSFVISAFTTTAANLNPVIKHQPSGRAPWYAAGSGATLACMLLFTLPRRRRWSALLAVILSVAALTAVGCSNTSTTGGTGGGGGGGTTPTSPTSPGTYTFTVTAISGALVHSAQVTLTVQ